LEEVYDATAKLPWWVCLVLAAISFGVGHMLASVGSPGPMTPQAIVAPAVIGLGVAIEILGPVVFVLAGAVSGFRQMQTPRVRAPASSAPTESRPGAERAAGTQDQDLYETWKDVSEVEAAHVPVDTSRWTMELLKALEWKRFELLCAGYFETLGFKSEVAREGADGGVDIHLYANGSSTPSVVVQCKAWKAYKVGIKPIRELLGVMTAAHVSEGIFVTTGSYTAEARECAAANHIDLIDGGDLLRKIAASRPEDHAALLQLATAGDFTTPTCPSCGIKMVERVAQKTGDKFWGCTRFPACRLTLRQRSS